MGIIGLISALIGLAIYFFKRKDAKNTPNAKSKKDIEEMDDALDHGDADRVALKFDELFQDADRHDSGQHETKEVGKRELGSD